MRNKVKVARQAFSRLLELQSHSESHGVCAAGNRSEVVQASLRSDRQQGQMRCVSVQHGGKAWQQKKFESRPVEEDQRRKQRRLSSSSISDSSQPRLLASKAPTCAAVAAHNLAGTLAETARLRANPADPAKPSSDWPSTPQANVLTVSGHSSKPAAPAKELSGAGEAADKVASQQDNLQSGLVDQLSSLKVNPVWACQSIKYACCQAKRLCFICKCFMYPCMNLSVTVLLMENIGQAASCHLMFSSQLVVTAD